MFFLNSDPTGEFGGLIGGELSAFGQLAGNGWNCINWTDVIIDAGLGAIGGGLANGLFKGAFKWRKALPRGGKPPSYSWEATKHWGKNNAPRIFELGPNQQRHHWLFQQNQGWGGIFLIGLKISRGILIQFPRNLIIGCHREQLIGARC